MSLTSTCLWDPIESKRVPVIIITLNSSKLIMPSPLTSTPAIIFRHSAIEHSSPKLSKTLCNSSAEIDPFLSISKTENASFRFSNTSAESISFVFNSTNSCKFMNPSPSASTSLIMFFNSSSLGWWPRLPIIDPSSDHEIFPSPLTSNFLNTCSNSSSIRSRELKELVRDATGGDLLDTGFVPLWLLSSLPFFFFRWNKFFKPMNTTGLKFLLIFQHDNKWQNKNQKIAEIWKGLKATRMKLMDWKSEKRD